jgi:hypothetical protein
VQDELQSAESTLKAQQAHAKKQATEAEKRRAKAIDPDYMVAVRWWHRDDADSERLTFMEDDYAAAADTADDFVHTARASSWDVFNSTELRAIKLTLTVVPGLTLSRAPRRSTRNGGSGQNPPAEVRLRLHAEEEQIILDACW